MSVQNIMAGIGSTEQYKIRKQTEIQQSEENTTVSQEIKKVDEYDKDNPVGEEVEGVYSVSHDEEGNLKVDYKQPASNSNSKSEGASPAAASKTEDSSDDDDNEEELEKLKQQRDAIKQQLNRESDEKVKSALRAQLQAIEMQIALKE